MGLVYADIELINGADKTLAEDGYLHATEVRRMPLTVLADSGAIRLAINERIRQQLGLLVRSNMVVALADGRKRSLDIAGPLRIKFGDRDCVTDAFVLPGDEEPLLGAVPMELMDLVILPAFPRLAYNPQHPEGPVFSMK